jgi:hypothetical protein
MSALVLLLLMVAELVNYRQCDMIYGGGAIPPFHYIITNCDSRTDRSPDHA